MAPRMNLIPIFLVMFVASTVALADTCGVTDFLEQLIQSVQSVQSNGKGCRASSEPRVGKAGPQGIAGPRGPPGIVDMDAVEQLIQRKIDENKDMDAIKQLIQEKIEENTDMLIESGPLVEVCYMGMKSRQIPNSAITTSSFHAIAEGYHGRIDHTGGNYGAWYPRANAIGQWLQVDFGGVKEVAGVITQGRYNAVQYVKTYKVTCGLDEDSLTTVRENGSDKVFEGNTDQGTKAYSRFPEVLSCRFVRIYPQSWHSIIMLRVEFVAGRCFNFSLPWQ